VALKTPGWRCSILEIRSMTRDPHRPLQREKWWTSACSRAEQPMARQRGAHLFLVVLPAIQGLPALVHRKHLLWRAEHSTLQLQSCLHFFACFYITAAEEPRSHLQMIYFG